MEEILELLNSGQYVKLRQHIMDMNVADIAACMEEMERDDLLKLFRILPKSMAADVFSYLEIETEQYIITSMSDKDAANIIDNLMADDATDLLEEMPANVVKRLLANASPDTRRDIN
ncbi:MAG: magnesium transporter, partial [Lachnospiraceae bacterium]|nr:magnesium transporter [Lachnospiraceae bacterium]